MWFAISFSFLQNYYSMKDEMLIKSSLSAYIYLDTAYKRLILTFVFEHEETSYLSYQVIHPAIFFNIFYRVVHFADALPVQIY